MKFYETENAKPQVKCPHHLVNKTAEEIVDYLFDHFNSDPETGKPANKSTAYMQAVADAIFDPNDWKAPICAKFPACGIEWASAAIIWYHGSHPRESAVSVYSWGYAR